jgi:hypothetical protein
MPQREEPQLHERLDRAVLAGDAPVKYKHRPYCTSTAGMLKKFNLGTSSKNQLRYVGPHSASLNPQAVHPTLLVPVEDEETEWTFGSVQS